MRNYSLRLMPLILVDLFSKTQCNTDKPGPEKINDIDK